MISKKKGAEDTCPSCQTMLVCREKDYKGEITLQWQYKDKEVAHFNYDFKTKKTSCKESSSSETTDNTTSARTINLDSLKHLTKEEQDKIIEETEKIGESLACQMKGIDNLVARGVVSDKYDRGMIFNALIQYRVH